MSIFRSQNHTQAAKVAAVVQRCTRGSLPSDLNYYVALFIADPGDPGRRSPPWGYVATSIY